MMGCSNFVFVIVLITVINVRHTQNEFIFPKVKLEALKAGGFRAFVPTTSTANLFAFHGNVNEQLLHLNSGSLEQETTTVTNGYWVVEFPTKLQIGNVVNYWVFINTSEVGYVKSKWWTVTDATMPRLTEVNKMRAKTMSENGWSLNAIANDIADYEFNTYENSNETRFFQNGILHLKPIRRGDNEVRGVLNFRNNCTSKQEQQCYYEQRSVYLLPPIKSAKITSKDSFRYGKVEIRAKLPIGDWIFPIIQLELKDGIDNNSPKVWIAYSRGNSRLQNSEGYDIGSKRLYVGPVLHSKDHGRSKETISELSQNASFNDNFHIYSLNWVPGKMTFLVDSREVGSVDLTKRFGDTSLGIGNNWTTPEAPFDREYVLSLGVGVGGVYDFPDGYTSNETSKPWVNRDRNFIRDFFNAKGTWSSTWRDPALQVDYVKVTAV